MKLSIRARMAQRAVALFEPNGPLREAIGVVRPTALKNLAQAALVAEVPEEMEIALRYQAAREVVPLAVAGPLLTELDRLKAEDPATACRAFSELLGHIVRLHRALPEVNQR